MTIPTRPAPAPPQMRNFSMNGGGSTAAADANASLEQLRLQLQQQQQQQQQQKLTIKLPPPPKGGGGTYAFRNHNNNNDLDGATSTSSITRKFPKARYAPATNWDDTPFDPFEGATTTTNSNSNFKKVPPPRPPPPKVLVNGRQKASNGSNSTSTKILSNIFHRKKTNSSLSSSNNAKQLSAARVYGVSSGNYAVNPSTQTNNDSNATASMLSAAAFTNSDWNAAWSTTTSSYTISNTTTLAVSQSQQDAQLISFDSPPSSPTFTQKSNSDCVSVDSFSSDSNFSSPQNGSVSQPESGFEDDFSATSRSRPATTSPLDPWEAFSAFNAGKSNNSTENYYCSTSNIGTAPVRNLGRLNATTTQDNPLCNGKNLVPPAPSVSMPTIIKPKISQKPKAPRPPVFGMVKSAGSGFDFHTSTSLPMSQCALPPPPSTATATVSILDVISGKADAIHLTNGAEGGDSTNYDDQPPYGIALYDFDGVEEGDLSFRENEKIYLLERVSEEWYRGRTRSGCEGILPVNFIEIRVPLPTKAQKVVASSNTITNNYNTLSSSIGLPKVRCLYNFPAEVEGDLALQENDMVTILYRINEDWLFGKIDNRQGQFPANFLEYIPTDIPLP